MEKVADCTTRRADVCVYAFLRYDGRSGDLNEYPWEDERPEWNVYGF
jgi:hypothetical protein